MNIFRTGWGLLVINSGFKKYMKNGQAIDDARAAGEHRKAMDIIAKGEDVFCDEVGAKLGVDVEVINPENIPADGNFLIVSNHQGYADIFAVVNAFRDTQIGFIAKSEFKKLKPLARMIEHTGSLFIERGNPREAIKTLREATEMLKQGYIMTIFPEGTRSHSNEMGEFKPGSFKFAQKAGVPILPITIIDSYKVFEEKNSLRPAHIKVVVHLLVHFEQMDRHEQNMAHETIEATIRSGLEQYAK